MSPDHHLGEQNTPLSRVRETEEPPQQGNRRNQRERKLKRGRHAGMRKMKRTDGSWRNEEFLSHDASVGAEVAERNNSNGSVENYTPWHQGERRAARVLTLLIVFAETIVSRKTA